MIEKLIEEIRFSRRNRQTLSALICALTLPDICGQVEYPKEKPSARYKKWYAKYVGQYEHPSINDDQDDNIPYANANLIYDLRCHLVHQGEADIDKQKRGLTVFRIINDPNFPKSTAFRTDSGKTGLEINVYDFVETLCLVAEGFYKDNKDKFDGETEQKDFIFEF